MSKETKTKTGGIVSAVILVLAVVLAMVVCIQVLTRGYVTIAGNSLFRVVTGSMEPTMPVGSILICRDTPIDDIREGDIVCFRSMGSAGVGKIITHRVVAVLQNGDGETLLETRGDANLSADGNYVQADNLIGRVVWYAGHYQPVWLSQLYRHSHSARLYVNPQRECPQHPQGPAGGHGDIGAWPGAGGDFRCGADPGGIPGNV